MNANSTVSGIMKRSVKVNSIVVSSQFLFWSLSSACDVTSGFWITWIGRTLQIQSISIFVHGRSVVLTFTSEEFHPVGRVTSSDSRYIKGECLPRNFFGLCNGNIFGRTPTSSGD